jgi:23S rRNA (guanosine2251-2'-O)-methyltransferase
VGAGAPGAAGSRRAPDRGLGGDQVEGRHAVRELLLAGRRKVQEVWVLGEQDEAEVLDDIAELAQSVNVPVRQVGRGKFFAQARTESSQGVLAKARALPEADLDDMVKGRRGRPAPFLLALDGVTDPGNLGALLRTAECAGVTGVVLPRHRAVHITPTVTKAAAGAVEYLDMTVVGGLPTALSRAREAGVWVIGLDSGGTETIYDLALADEPVMLVLGAEGQGLSRLVRQRCDAVVAIPLGGRLGSLNVSAAGALACFEVVRRRQLTG